VTGYHIYANTGIGDPINYNSPIATAYVTFWQSPSLEGPSNWSFAVRAFDSINGLEEQNIDCVVEVQIDANGNDVSNTPAPPVGLLAIPVAGGGIRVEWSYPAIDAASAPTGFNVFTGIGTPNYSSPAATAGATTGLIGQYSATITGLVNGTTYAVGVRAFNATAEETNTSFVQVTALSVGPRAVVGLTGIATSQS
jgi:hypothetical protein